MPDRSEKMENDDERKCNNNEARVSVDTQNRTRTDSECSGEDDIARSLRAQHFMVGGLTGASPPKFVSVEEIMKAANGMTNMALAHEIAVDKNFRLEKFEPAENTLHKTVKEIIHKAFWDVLAEQLAADPPNYDKALVLLGEIKETLEDLVLPHHTKIKDNIKEVLDVDLIKQQAEQGVLDFHHYVQYIISIMGKLCAPIRDDRIRELTLCTDVIETFKGILEILQLMRLDMANFTITIMRPTIVASSVEYEKAKFAEFLKIQEDGLKHTKEWLLKNLEPEKIISASDASVVRQLTHNLLTEAYLDLLEWDSSPNAETLMMDQGRLVELRDKTCRLCVVGSVLLVANNTVGAPVQGVSSFKNNVKQHLAVLLESVTSNKELEAVMPNIVLQVKVDVKTTLQEIGAPELSESTEAVLDGQILEIMKPDHKIRHLVSLRMRQFLQKIILSQTAAPQQIPPGLSSLQEELAAIASQFLILVTHNRSVFGEYYHDIVKSAITNKTAANANTTSMEQA